MRLFSISKWRLSQDVGLGCNGGGECIHELKCSGNKFHSCIFHPNYPSLLVIRCYQIHNLYFILAIRWYCKCVLRQFCVLQSLELWNMAEKKSVTIPVGLVASASRAGSIYKPQGWPMWKNHCPIEKYQFIRPDSSQTCFETSIGLKFSLYSMKPPFDSSFLSRRP